MKKIYGINYTGQRLSVCQRNRFHRQSFAYFLILRTIVLNLSMFVLFLGMADAATVDRRISYNLDKYDSINVVRYEDAVTIDSTWYLPNGTGHDSTSFDSTLSIDNTKYTIIDTKIRYHGDNVWKSYTFEFEAAATAAVSYADITTIGDTLVARATAYPGVFYGPGAGSGLYTVNIYTIDTSGTDDTLYRAQVSIQTITGVNHQGPLMTNSNGYVAFNLDADSFRVVVSKEGYVFVTDTIVVAANQTDSVLGRNYVVAAPSSATVCRVYKWVRSSQGDILPGAILHAALVNNNVEDTCSTGVPAIIRREEKSKPSDPDSGFVYIDLIPSTCYSPNTKYKFWIEYNNVSIYSLKILSVPDSTSWLLTD
jgi:hypothetical protein